MDCKATYIPYKETGFYSGLVLDYLGGNNTLTPFYDFEPNKQGVEDAITKRTNYTVNRAALVSALHNQYEGFKVSKQVNKNIDLLNKENTFTICTAHQPNLLTGYLYFIYKIVHTIKLADELNEQYADKRFVPVYFMGSEDNDLDELGKFRYNSEQYVWDADGQTGAVGRVDTTSLKPIIDDLFKKLGPPNEHTEILKELITEAYINQKNIAQATRHLVNELFGLYGLIVFDPDNATVKTELVDIFQDDLFNNTANDLAGKQADKLAEQYKAQAYPRPINLFYLKDDIRERIEQQGDKWIVLNNDISWNENELKEELKTHPEHFSPNVILRGVLQEKLLPNVTFIGGGAEVAYWMQLKPVFEHYKVFYPAILLRQSVLWIEHKYVQLQAQLDLSDKELFAATQKLATKHAVGNSSNDLSLDTELSAIAQQLKNLQSKATSIDKTLSSSAQAVTKKIEYQIAVLEKKMIRAEKRNMKVELDRIVRLKDGLFPKGSLQERHDNFINFYPVYGQDFIKQLYTHTKPLKNEFLIISETS